MTSLTFTAFLLVFVGELIYSTLGEEIFFRGFLANLFFRRLSFPLANFLQSIIFVLPHFFLLVISKSLWPFLVIDFLAVLCLGWLLYHSKSILPGLLAHTLVNASFICFLISLK